MILKQRQRALRAAVQKEKQMCVSRNTSQANHLLCGCKAASWEKSWVLTGFQIQPPPPSIHFVCSKRCAGLVFYTTVNRFHSTIWLHALAMQENYIQIFYLQILSAEILCPCGHVLTSTFSTFSWEGLIKYILQRNVSFTRRHNF